jgi:hypothetical protein
MQETRKVFNFPATKFIADADTMSVPVTVLVMTLEELKRNIKQTDNRFMKGERSERAQYLPLLSSLFQADWRLIRGFQ